MTRKDFELIAQVFKKQSNFEYLVFSQLDPVEQANGQRIHDHNVAVINNFSQMFADALSTTNASFDRERFLTACGVDEVTK